MFNMPREQGNENVCAVFYIFVTKELTLPGQSVITEFMCSSPFLCVLGHDSSNARSKVT